MRRRSNPRRRSSGSDWISTLERRMSRRAKSRCRQLVPHPPVQFPTASLRRPATPLLEEERNFVITALISDGAHPLKNNLSLSGTAFSSRNDQVDAIEVQTAEVTDERLTLDKPQLCRLDPALVHPAQYL